MAPALPIVRPAHYSDMTDIDTMKSLQHPMDDFGYCPRCGSRHFGVNDPKSKICADCGFVLYHNSAAAVAAIVVDENDRLLVTRRAFEPARHTLDLPGGFVDPGEEAETAVRREVFEETGCRVRTADYLFSLPNAYVYSAHTVHTTDLFFRCTIEGCGAAMAHDDAAEVLWIPKAELDPAQFGLASIRKGVARLLKTL